MMSKKPYKQVISSNVRALLTVSLDGVEFADDLTVDEAKFIIRQLINGAQPNPPSTKTYTLINDDPRQAHTADPREAKPL
jgi:hypothetical protein